MTKIVELFLDCPECGGVMLVQLTPESQVKEIFEACASCRALVKV